MRSYFNLAAELYLVKYILFKLKHFEKNVQVPKYGIPLSKNRNFNSAILSIPSKDHNTLIYTLGLSQSADEISIP